MMTKRITTRATLDIIILISVVHGWWFAALPLGVIGAWRYLYFVELILAGVMYDALFGSAWQGGAAGYLMTGISILTYAAILVLRKKFRN